ncbi:MAG: ABC transporter ATP-binding protein [Syntrophales bacterium]|jgi:branched-chain amino acid transport system ATP-binding protein|nr:ABC transporter ATP-binding protein [Syntrophales bacterium]
MAISKVQTAPILQIENLKRLFGGLAALNGATFEIRENEVLGILGPNGAGKTTLINVIAGIYLPTSGRIFFEGRDITNIPAHRICRLGIGRTFQLAKPLEDLSLAENVMVGALFGSGCTLREARKRSEETCEFVGLGDVQRGISKVTALEIKKMQIAHALAARPRILFLDEVMAGLNTDETFEMIELVRKIHDRGVTIGIVEHVMRVIKELTNRVVVLDWGQVIAEGPYEAVSANPLVISAYLGEET